MKQRALSLVSQPTVPGGCDRPMDTPSHPWGGRALAHRLQWAATALCAALLLAVPAARAETELPDMPAALATLAELEERGAGDWTDSEAEAYFVARAAVDASLRQDPEGPDAEAWFASRLRGAQSDVDYGWLLYSPATWVAIAGRADTLAMDRALWFAWAVAAPWGLYALEVDPCLAVKAFTLQDMAGLSGKHAEMASAIPAVAEAERLRLWSENQHRAALLADRPVDQAAVDHAALTAQIMTEMLVYGATDLAALQQGFFVDIVTGRLFTEAEIADAYAGLDKDWHMEIAAARPFFAGLEALYVLPTDEAMARLCR